MNQILTLLSLFSIIFIGILSRKLNIIPEDANKLFNKFIFNISMPAIVFLSITTLNIDQLVQFIPFICVNILLIFIGYLLTFSILKLFKINKEKKGAMLYASNAGNVIYFGFPILLNLYGQGHFSIGVLYATVVITIGDLLGFYLLGINNTTEKVKFKETTISFFKNPIVRAALLGLIAVLINISLPNFIVNTLETLGKTTTGLALFSLGIYLYSKIDLSDISYKLFSSFIKLVFFPALTFFIVFFVYKLDRTAAETSVIMASMPTAVFSLIVSEAYNLDKKLTSNIIVISSLLFLLTSTFWVWVFTLI